ncbi:hypothetical protein E1B28_003773 [Marasmius oreades]|uniref:SAP domain-containing protein n=1 Tax=Marasmius oreades TaxID=181124 RepID=A0A9P8ABG2_9AGAR|nr:uncharacterized protein E1B28_003773 [Marasmius oreades]KAG7096329.1 hypothetical protein E1B28_003773 [Marasmius oreades]
MGSTSTDELTPLKRSSEWEFPGAGGDVGAVRKINLSHLKWEQLKGLCQDFKLASSGTKAMLVARLQDYSSNRAIWNLSKPGVHRPHKGLHAETKNKALKGSHKRRAKIIKEADPGDIQRSKDTRSQTQKADMVLWAKSYIHDHPPRPRSPKREADANDMLVDNERISAQLTGIREQLIAIAHSHMPTSTTMSTYLSPTACALLAPHASPFSAVPLSLISPATPTPVNAPPLPNATSSHTPIPPPVTQCRLSVQLPSAQPLSPSPAVFPLAAESLQPPMAGASNSRAEMLTHLRLRDGTTLRFCQSDVPDPKNLTFATNIDLLGILWTESNPNFREDRCEVRIDGHGIALEHWPTVFKKTTRGGDDRRWEGLKKTWDKWRWVGLRYNQSTPANFWAEFTDDQGKQMNITTIYRILLEQRKAAKAK